MSQTANVQSIDAIRGFRQEMKRYLESMRSVLDALKMESSKATGWIEQDRTSYWPRAAKRADDELVAARNALSRCKMAAMEGQRKSCNDEKSAVARAVQRLRHCESQVKVVRHWRQKMRHNTEQFSGKIARLTHYVENDIPKAIAALDRMIASLEKYTKMKAPRLNEPRLPSRTGASQPDPAPPDPTVEPGTGTDLPEESD